MIHCPICGLELRMFYGRSGLRGHMQAVHGRTVDEAIDFVTWLYGLLHAKA